MNITKVSNRLSSKFYQWDSALPLLVSSWATDLVKICERISPGGQKDVLSFIKLYLEIKPNLISSLNNKKSARENRKLDDN